MKTNKGFSTITIVLIIIALLVIGGFVYYTKFSNQKISDSQSAAVSKAIVPASKIVAPTSARLTECTENSPDYPACLNVIVPSTSATAPILVGEDVPAGTNTASNHGIKPTSARLTECTENSPDYPACLNVGASGSAVTSLQESLISLGYTVVADGNFGPKTVAAVKAFQTANGLKADGIPGAKTFVILGRESPTKISNLTTTTSTTSNTTATAVLPNNTNCGSYGYPSCVVGTTGLAISDLQSKLIKAGFLVGTPNKIFGPETETAVKNFQKAEGLKVDGQVGKITYGKLINFGEGVKATSKIVASTSSPYTVDCLPTDPNYPNCTMNPTSSAKIGIAAPSSETNNTTFVTPVSCGFIYQNPASFNLTKNPNTSDNEIASYIIQNICAYPFHVTSINVRPLQISGSVLVGDLSNLKIKDILGQPLSATMSSLNINGGAFTTDFDVLAGSSKIINLYTNLSSDLGHFQAGMNYNASGVTSSSAFTSGPVITIQ